MTTLLVGQLKIDSSDATVSLDELLELLSLQTTDTKFDEVWVTVFCRRLTPRTRDKICESLHVPGQHLLCFPRPLDAKSGSRLIASAIAFLGGHQTVVLYDGNSDLPFGRLVPHSTNLNLHENGVFGYLNQLDDFHRRDRFSDIVTCLDRLLSGLEGERSSPGRALQQLLRPITRFIRTLNALLLYPPRCDCSPNEGLYDSLSLVDFSTDVDRLSKIHGELSQGFAAIDFVEPSANFFRYGSRALGVLRTAHPSGFRDVFPNVLSWWYAYHLATSKELSNLGHFSSALLHLTRAFEAYVLAHLWRLGQIEVRGLFQRLYLSDGTMPGLDTLQRALERTVPQSGMELLYADLERLRQHRNGNLLVHGFHLPNEDTVRRARVTVKGIVSCAEAQLPRGVEILRGIIGAFSKGENRRGDMGRVIAEILIGSDETFS